jgi:hypothetical protein
VPPRQRSRATPTPAVLVGALRPLSLPEDGTGAAILALEYGGLRSRQWHTFYPHLIHFSHRRLDLDLLCCRKARGKTFAPGWLQLAQEGRGKCSLGFSIPARFRDLGQVARELGDARVGRGEGAPKSPAGRPGASSRRGRAA